MVFGYLVVIVSGFRSLPATPGGGCFRFKGKAIEYRQIKYRQI